MRFSVHSNNFFSFLIGKVSYSLLRSKVKFHPGAFIFSIDKTICVRTESVHMSIRRRNSSVAHNNSYLQKCFWQRRPKIPVGIRTSHIGRSEERRVGKECGAWGWRVK